MHTEDVVVDREHVEVGSGIVTGGGGDGNLRVIDTGEVAGTGRLVLLGLEREGVRVDTRVGGAGVVEVGLHLVEVLTGLLLEAVLAVKHKLELVDGTDSLLGELGGTSTRGRITTHKEGSTRGTWGDETVGGTHGEVLLENNLGDLTLVGKVPHLGTGDTLVAAPHKLLDGVVVRKADLLGTTGGGNSVSTSVLDLLDQVFMTLLREPATLFGVKVDVVGPYLEGTGVQVDVEIRRQIEIDADFVVLQSDQRQVQTGVAVEEENQRQVDSVASLGGRHLTVSELLGLIQVKLGVQTPPLLVVLVNALTTDRQFDTGDRTLRDPARIVGGIGRDGRRGSRQELDVHVTNQITVTGDGHGHAAGVGGGTVHGLFDVLHREVSVALVFGLEEGHLRVTGKVDILGAVSYELHKTTGHFESCCTIHRENNSGQTRIF